MTKPLPRIVIEGPAGSVLVRVRRNGGYYIKATRHDGDAVGEMRMAAQAAELMQTAVRHAANDPDLRLKVGPIRHIEDH